jgi:hypothetical protein
LGVQEVACFSSFDPSAEAGQTKYGELTHALAASAHGLCIPARNLGESDDRIFGRCGI